MAKEGDVVYGNMTKLKAIKNKMAPPFRICSFDIVFGKGIDKKKELLTLANEFEVIKKWGDKITFNDVKYTTEEFETHLLVNTFFEELKSKVIEKIKTAEVKIEEPVEE